jgi:hypothetical protein
LRKFQNVTFGRPNIWCVVLIPFISINTIVGYCKSYSFQIPPEREV